MVPMYHAVGPEAPVHLKHLYAPRHPKDFSADLKTFCNYFDPISLSDLLEWKKSPDQGRYFHLTFDDGLREVNRFARPIVESHELPATLFINPSFVDRADMMYRLKTSLLVEHLPQLQQTVHKVLPGDGTARKKLLAVTFDQRGELDEIAEQGGVDLAAYVEEQNPYLSLSELRELHSAGWTMGGHSMDHPDFGQLSLQEQCQQARESVDWVGKYLGEKIRAFAFPYSDLGVNNAFFEQCSMDLTFGTSKLKKDPQSRHIQRLPMERGRSSGWAILEYEYLAYQAKRVLGRHIIQRRQS